MENLTQVRLQDTIGKTIKGIGYDNYRCAVLFTDNTFICVESEFDNVYYNFDNLVTWLNYCDSDEPMLSGVSRVFVDAGIVNVEELMVAGRKRKQTYEEEKKEKRYNEYLRLKKEFENE